MGLKRTIAAAIAALVVGAVAAGAAAASQLLTANASGVRIAVNSRGQALVTYSAGGRKWHVLVWNAINARPPSASTPQVRFRIDRSGGWKTYGHPIWQRFKNVCQPYSGPALPYVVAACTAPDGSEWALQSWQRLYPDLGWLPWLPSQRAYELHISHWSGELAKLAVYTDWVFSKHYHQLFGKLTYRGVPIYGFKATRYGARLDSYGRLIYVDTFNSVYGEGWRRENSFLTHNPTGIWCYGFYAWDPYKGGYQHPPDWPRGKLRGPGNGSKYRVTTEGPGVTPDIQEVVAGLNDYDPSNPEDVAYERRQNDLLDVLAADDKSCKHH